MTLEHLWAGWRQEYVERASKASQSGAGRDGGLEQCVFCRILASGPPSAENGIVWRDGVSCAVLNAYPYATGHLLVMPERHMSELNQLTDVESPSLWEATRKAVSVLAGVYEPDGANVGANLGTVAGAGIPSHLHLHALPRWAGDTNFMTTVSGVRVMPEFLEVTWAKIREAWTGT